MISNIRVQNFRSYPDSSFEFESGVNIIVGPNASGKTSLLEAVALICSGKSFRAKDSDVVMFDKPWSRIDAYVSEAQRTLKLIKRNEGIDKEYIVDDQVFRRPDKKRLVPTVVFEPNHLLLLAGPPEARREFADNIIEHTQTTYSKLLRDYKKTLMQRNALLKSGRKDQDQMFVWNLRLSEQGQSIVDVRISLLDDMNKKISRIYSKIADKKHEIQLAYKSKYGSENYASSMLKHLESTEDLDYLRGFTGIGPHRDDIEIFIEKKPTHASASRGETRTMLLALKMYELEVIEEAVGKHPILLLDDVFSELDGARRKALTGYLNEYQSFITTTDADILSHKLVETANTILLA